MRLAMKRYAWKDSVGVPESVSKLLDEYVYPHSRKCVCIRSTAACVLYCNVLYCFHAHNRIVLPEEEIPKPSLNFLRLFDDACVAADTEHIRSNDDWRRERLYTEGVSNYYLSILRRLRAKYLVLAEGGGWADEVGGKLSYAEYKDFILTHKLLDGVKRVNIDSIHLDERIEGEFLDAKEPLSVCSARHETAL